MNSKFKFTKQNIAEIDFVIVKREVKQERKTEKVTNKHDKTQTTGKFNKKVKMFAKCFARTKCLVNK